MEDPQSHESDTTAQKGMTPEQIAARIARTNNAVVLGAVAEIYALNPDEAMRALSTKAFVKRSILNRPELNPADTYDPSSTEYVEPYSLNV